MASCVSLASDEADAYTIALAIVLARKAIFSTRAPYSLLLRS